MSEKKEDEKRKGSEEDFIDRTRFLPLPVKPNQVTRSFYISGMPLVTYLKFKKFCIEQCGDNYATAIDKLLNMAEVDFKYSLLCDELMEQKKAIISVTQTLMMIEQKQQSAETEKVGKKEEDTEIISTMGGNKLK